MERRAIPTAEKGLSTSRHLQRWLRSLHDEHGTATVAQAGVQPYKPPAVAWAMPFPARGL
jgi:hypothetical protein